MAENQLEQVEKNIQSNAGTEKIPDNQQEIKSNNLNTETQQPSEKQETIQNPKNKSPQKNQENANKQKDQVEEGYQFQTPKKENTKQEQAEAQIIEEPKNLRSRQKNEYLGKRKASEGIQELYGNQMPPQSPHTKKEKQHYSTFLYRPNIGLPHLHEFLNTNIDVTPNSQIQKIFLRSQLREILYLSRMKTSHQEKSGVKRKDIQVIAMLYVYLCIWDLLILIKKYQFHKNMKELNQNAKQQNVFNIFPDNIPQDKKNYPSTKEHGIRSRKVYKYGGHSLKPLTIEYMENLGEMQDLIKYACKMPNKIQNNRRKLEPINVRSLTTIPETHMMFNLSCEPAFKYSLFAMCDKNDDSKSCFYNSFQYYLAWTSRKLKTQSLYIENSKKRYEIIHQEVLDNVFHEYDQYRLSEVLNPFKIDNEFMRKNGSPLSNKYIRVMHKDLDWSEFEWGTDFLQIKGHERINGLKTLKWYQDTR